MAQIKSFRALRIKRKKCQICGLSRADHIQRYGRDLDVHHLYSLGEGNLDRDSSHLMVLCVTCHHRINHHKHDPYFYYSWREAFWRVPLPEFQNRIKYGRYHPYYWENKIRRKRTNREVKCGQNTRRDSRCY